MRSVIAGLETVTVQAAPGNPSAVVVLCHGFGAPGTDLVGLAEALVEVEPSLASVRFHFPAAPISMEQFGYGDAHAWWLIDFQALQAAQRGGTEAMRAFRSKEPEGMAASRKALSALTLEVLNSTKLPFSKLVLGGFSQGSMLSADVALRLEEAPAGLVALSGTLLLEDVWRTKAKARAGLPVFQSHGRFDEVLAFSAAKDLEQLFNDAGMPVEFHEFAGGHGIPPDVLRALASYLVKRVG